MGLETQQSAISYDRERVIWLKMVYIVYATNMFSCLKCVRTIVNHSDAIVFSNVMQTKKIVSLLRQDILS